MTKEKIIQANNGNNGNKYQHTSQKGPHVLDLWFSYQN